MAGQKIRARFSLGSNRPAPEGRARGVMLHCCARDGRTPGASGRGEDHLFKWLRRAVMRPSMVWTRASTVGLRERAARALEVSGPMEAVFICGKRWIQPGKSKRELKCCPVELLVKVIQSAPLSAS